MTSLQLETPSNIIQWMTYVNMLNCSFLKNFYYEVQNFFNCMVEQKKNNGISFLWTPI